ncbi:hypothetical protein K2X40_04755 [Candidatus Babeliales bacterium]|nr:hypothetical protein [Candidatus Babeliales bacterium]
MNAMLKLFNLMLVLCTLCFLDLKSAAVPFADIQQSFFMQKQLVAKENQEQWITIFVHGTYGSALSLVSFFRLLNDDTKNSLYRRLQKQLRASEVLYSGRFMAQRGLRAVDCSINLEDNKSIVVPIVSAYRAFAQQVNAARHETFYTFGWNGLLSQAERRLEAVRFYNELSGLVKSYQARGVNPKIRLIAHSHGGNVCANLAAIYTVLRNKKASAQYEVLRECVELLDNLESVKKEKKNKKLYKRPTNKNLHVEELIIYGTPIQDETEPFFFSSFFGKVFNFYSENDTIQAADFVSTKGRRSRQRIMEPRLESLKNKIMQARIMVERDAHAKPVFSTKNFNIWAALRGGSLLSAYPYDPTHADFWYADWEKKETFFDPLPVVVFTPLLLQALSQCEHGHDVALNISSTADQALFSCFDCAHKKRASSYSFSLSALKKIRDHFKASKSDWAELRFQLQLAFEKVR